MGCLKIVVIPVTRETTQVVKLEVPAVVLIPFMVKYLLAKQLHQ